MPIAFLTLESRIGDVIEAFVTEKIAAEALA